MSFEEEKLYPFEELDKDTQQNVIETWCAKYATSEDMFETDDDYYESYVEELINMNPEWRFNKYGERL